MQFWLYKKEYIYNKLFSFKLFYSSIVYLYIKINTNYNKDIKTKNKEDYIKNKKIILYIKKVIYIIK